jgi:RNA polymerase primary sigma factor
MRWNVARWLTGSRFAALAVAGAVQPMMTVPVRAMANTGKTIRIPAYMNELLVKWRRAAANLRDKFGREATQEEISTSLNLPRKKLAIIRNALRIHKTSPDADLNETGRSIDQTLMDETSPTPDANLVRADDVEQMMECLGNLDNREAEVLRMRFGLDSEDAKTLKEIGDRLGLTRERVRQIERGALGKLGDRMGILAPSLVGEVMPRPKRPSRNH